MIKTMKVEGPMHVVCQCDKCKAQIAFNAEVVGYVLPQRTWVGLTDEDDDTQAFEPDWANFANGRAAGRAEAFEQIADKVKEMPWENDTKDSFLIWLKEQNI